MRVLFRVVVGLLGALWLLLNAALTTDDTIRSSISVIAGSIALALLFSTGSFLVLRFRPFLRWTRSTIIGAAVSVGLVLSAPVPIWWNDGCNGYLGTTYAVVAPYVLIERPSETRVVRGGMQTLIRLSFNIVNVGHD